jgi:hypothetical protein
MHERASSLKLKSQTCRGSVSDRRSDAGERGEPQPPTPARGLSLSRWTLRSDQHSTTSRHVYEIRPRADKRGVDLISDAIPYTPLWYRGPNAIRDAIDHAKLRSRSHDRSDTGLRCKGQRDRDSRAQGRFQGAVARFCSAGLLQLRQPY